MPPEANGVPFRANGVPPKPQDQLTASRSKQQVEERRDLCFKCQQPGHRARECRSRPFSVNAIFPVMSLQANGQPKDYANTTPVMVNGSKATALLDTGCQYPVLVHERHVRDEDRTDERVSVVYTNGYRETLPAAYIELESPYIQGRVKAACVAQLRHDVTLGSKYFIPRPNPRTCRKEPVEMMGMQIVKTREEERAVAEATESTDNTLLSDLEVLQDGDRTLGWCKDLALEGTKKHTREGEVSFVRQEGVLYRLVGKGEKAVKQLVVPDVRRGVVLRLAHQGWRGEHFSIADTTRKVVEQSYWPRVQGDVWRFCRACNECQEATRRTGGETVPLDEEQAKGEGEYELCAVEVVEIL